MYERIPIGVVMQDGDWYVGTCDEVGTTGVGRTVAEAFANLHEATWRCLAAKQCVDDADSVELS